MASWLADASSSLLPAAIEAKVRLLLLDTFGCAVAGFTHPEARRFAEASGATGKLSPPGFPPSLGPVQLGQVMAMAACWDEACEGLARAHGRPGLHAVPAALAVGLAENMPLGQVLTAIAAGYEIGGRLGEALRIRPKMHVDGTWGTVAAAVAARAVAKSGASAIVHAIDAAVCMIPASLYRPVQAGSALRNLYAGQGVARGIEAALALAAGVAVPTGAIDDVGDVLFNDEAGHAFPAAGTWVIEEGYFKPFAAVRHVHYGAQAALDWRKQFGAATQTISGLSLETYPEALTYCGNRAPQTAIQAQFSLTYGIAHGLARGSLGPEAYRVDALSDPEIARLEALLRVAPNGHFPSGRGARLLVERDGETSEVEVLQVTGDPDLPMGADDIRDKFLEYVVPVLGQARASALADAIITASRNAPVAKVMIG